MSIVTARYKRQMIDCNGSPDYVEFLHAIDEAMLYHSPKYHQLLAAVAGIRVETNLFTDEGGRIRAALSIARLEGRYGVVVNSLPFYGSHGGVLWNDPIAAGLAASHYHEIATAKGVAAATLVTNPLQAHAPLLPFTLAGEALDHRLSQWTDIAVDTADGEVAAQVLMSRFHQKTRNMIRKALRVGIVVERDSSDMETLNRIHVENMAALSASAKPRGFFEEIRSVFRAETDFTVYHARLDGRRVASLLCFFFKDVVEYYTPAVDVHYRDKQPLSLLIFQAMCDAAVAGMRRWNWGGTWPSQTSLHRFKKRWGTTDLAYHYLCQINDRSILNHSVQELRREYEFFYVAPYAMLRADGGTS